MTLKENKTLVVRKCFFEIFKYFKTLAKTFTHYFFTLFRFRTFFLRPPLVYKHRKKCKRGEFTYSETEFLAETENLEEELRS